MPRRTQLLAVLGLALLTAAGWNNTAALFGGGRDRLPAPRPAPPDRWQGVASCSAAACHHGNGPRGAAGSEYSTWADYDPHARAYAALLLDRSKTIVRNLARGKSHVPAHEDATCLNCHVHPEYTSQKGLYTARFADADGVGCEACHGPAERWRTAHYADPAWRGLTISQKATRGMRDTKTILGRARVCVDCHVGAPGMDVNHDLIAAGHPRLNFEFAAYHALLPHHWSDAKDKDPATDLTRHRARKDFEAQAWAVGQVVSAQAALRLLEHRAAKGVWPEFAEYDCFACHHDLKEPSWRQQQKLGNRKPGSYPWGSWYQGMVPRALSAEGVGGTENYLATLDDLRREMEVSFPAPERVAEKARAAAGFLGPLLKKLPTAKPLPVPALFRTVALSEGASADASWDHAAQYYLALAALHNAWKDTRQAPVPDTVRPALRELGSRLRFPPGYDSPRDFRPQDFRAQVDRLAQALK